LLHVVVIVVVVVVVVVVVAAMAAATTAVVLVVAVFHAPSLKQLKLTAAATRHTFLSSPHLLLILHITSSTK
jgi:hypothetical protein